MLSNVHSDNDDRDFFKLRQTYLCVGSSLVFEHLETQFVFFRLKCFNPGGLL